jgi:predicted amidophosphoribosyltransferase
MAPWAYEGTARALVLALKVGGSRGAAVPMAGAMCAEAQHRGLSAEIVTWVPGRRADLRRRGFDHAEVLARGVARRLGLPAAALVSEAASRPHQTSLSATQRRANLSGAFAAARCTRAVVLVDDLVTTGATAGSCAAALRSSGAPSVEVLAACRA